VVNLKNTKYLSIDQNYSINQSIINADGYTVAQVVEYCREQAFIKMRETK